MNTETITLGDGTLVLITYTAGGKVVQITSVNPLFSTLVGPEFDLYIGAFTDNVIATLADVIAIVASAAP